MSDDDKIIGPAGNLPEDQTRVAVAVQSGATLAEFGHRRRRPQTREQIRATLHRLVDTVCDSLENETL